MDENGEDKLYNIITFMIGVVNPFFLFILRRFSLTFFILIYKKNDYCTECTPFRISDVFDILDYLLNSF